jgi:hypothetical protein
LDIQDEKVVVRTAQALMGDEESQGLLGELASVCCEQDLHRNVSGESIKLNLTQTLSVMLAAPLDLDQADPSMIFGAAAHRQQGA